MLKPHINVTPLIDVLLVLLIIFMVVTPLKPSSFKARIPAESRNSPGRQDPLTLVVSVNSDGSLKLNRENIIGTIDNPDDLMQRLHEVFRARTENGVISERLASNIELPPEERIEKTDFIKAPQATGYGQV